VLYPTHPVAGYLLAVVLRLPVVPMVVGAALPDLIDKPLGLLGVADQYHTVAHSVFGLGVPLALAARSRAWLVVAVGWVSHLALDATQMIINGRPGDARFLLWPVVEHESQVQLPPVEFAAFYIGTRASAVELFIWVGALAALARRRLLDG
jgi:hypothetical protein